MSTVVRITSTKLLCCYVMKCLDSSRTNQCFIPLYDRRKSLAKERGFWGLVVDGNAGGSTFDGFLLAASQEVGHVILTLPYTFSLVG